MLRQLKNQIIMKNQIINYGSYDSTGKDICILTSDSLTENEVNSLCSEIKGMKSIAVSVKNGVVSWCSRGLKDEINNAILSTYHLHRQKYPCPITKYLERNSFDKIFYVASYFNFFILNPNIDLNTVNLKPPKDIDLILTSFLSGKILENNKLIENTAFLDNCKFIAFQLIQLHALLYEKIEIFTKSDAIKYEPNLRDYISRINSSVEILNDFKDSVFELIKEELIVIV